MVSGAASLATSLGSGVVDAATGSALAPAEAAE